MAFSDEWLVPTLSTLVSEAQIAKVRRDARECHLALGSAGRPPDEHR